MKVEADGLQEIITCPTRLDLDLGYLKALIIQAGKVHCWAYDDGDIELHHPELSDVGLAVCNLHLVVCDVLSGLVLQRVVEQKGLVQLDVLTQGCTDGRPVAAVAGAINV